ncbi:hypothetical protein PVAND_002899 [Polypedilum vanderplanki]|uniref:Metalloendopeptidase n=1 Tax=Polypedilum vanderplanki TaxID=319348 RepID=A0A9J6BSJ0_POLVA|nr:hypothetical protein PVAND_002899 [Polypedilum vanderplanki]
MFFFKTFLFLIVVFYHEAETFKLDLSKIISTSDESSGKALNNWNILKSGNAEEQGNYFEGDIILNLDQRNGIRLPTQKWDKGIIPYKIEGGFSSKQKNVISDAIDQIQKKTCLKFRPRGGEEDYILITNENTGCWSSVGKIGNAQKVNLQDECLLKFGTVIHELLHAIGFYHEQSRSDRDIFVKILTENILSDRRDNFMKLNEGEDETFGVSYDYESVMHYSPLAFTSNGKPTIKSLKGEKSNMGQREKLSEKDIKKINKMYC